MQKAIDLLNKGLDLAKSEKHLEAVSLLKPLLKSQRNPEIKKILLFQSAVCYMWLEEYDEAKKCLQRHLRISKELEIYEMLASIYDIKKDRKRSCQTYREIIKLDRNNLRAMINILANTNPSSLDLNESLLFTEYMDCLIASGEIGSFSQKVICESFNTAFSIANKLTDTDRALVYFDSFASFVTPELKESLDYYRQMVAAVFSCTIYSEHHGNEKQIDLMWEVYNLFKPEHVNTFKRDTSSFRDINIGFLSSDLFFHPVGRFLLALFKNKFNNSGINYFCYDTRKREKNNKNDDVTAALKKHADKFTSIGALGTEESEKLILKDNLDILFDLNGVSRGNKRELVVRRLAPVQLTWIGFPCTSAVPNVDYTIVDYVTDPAGYSHKFYTEKLAYMSKTFLCYPMVFNFELDVFTLKPPPFLKNGYITFASFNTAAKFTDNMLKAWARILNEVPDSKLIIRSVTGAQNEISIYGLKAKFERNGIDMSRLDIVPGKDFFAYLQEYNEVDIVLDTYPFNGATTTCDSFLMGVPVVSMYGYRHLERVGLDMLTHVGLSDLAVPCFEKYIEKAVELANDAQRLTDIKKNLRDTFSKSPLCDTGIFKEEFENVMRKLHIRHRMESSRAADAKKDRSQIVNEVIRGLKFITVLIYTEDDRDVVRFVKRDLFSLQTLLCAILEKEGGADAEVLEKYKKAVSFFSEGMEIDVLKTLSDNCLLLLSNLL